MGGETPTTNGTTRSVARRLARAASLTTTACAFGGLALLAAEVAAACARTYAKPDLRLANRATVGRAGRPALRLVLLGDASALGVGVDDVEHTLGGQLARLLAAGQSPRRVELWSVAVAHSESADLATQVARALVGSHPDVAVILVGANDIVRLRRPSESAVHLGTAVRRLRDAGVAPVVGTCPDLGALRAFAPPLRQLLGLYGRRLARRQAMTVRAAGGVPVDLGAKTGAVFRADAGTLCSDGFHPSADGYRVWAHTLLPAVENAAARSATR